MSGMYKQFETSPQDEKKGIWLDYGTHRVRIARAGGANKNFQKRLEKLTHPYRRAIATDNIDPEIAKKIMREVYADTVILDWETLVDGEMVPGIEQPDTEELAPRNKETVMKVLKDLPELFGDIQEQAGSLALFRAALREEVSGN